MTTERTEALDTDVLIVGAGMVGLTLGVALAGARVRVAVIDRADPTHVTDAAFDGRTSAIAFGSQRALDALGVWPHLGDAASPILDIRVSDGHRPLFLHYDHREVGDAPLGWIVENRDIRRALFARAAEMDGLTLLAPATLGAVSREPVRARATVTAGGRTFDVAAQLVVAADGRNSPLRQAADIPVSTWRYDQTAIVCTARHERPHGHVAHEIFLPAGPFAILPMTDSQGVHRSSIVWTEKTARAAGYLALDDGAFSAELATRFGGFLGEVALLGPRWSYPLSLLHATRYVDRRLVLAGDAAHAIHPIAGQGLNLGLRDVAALAEVLVEAHRLGLDLGGADIAARYQRWRRFDNTVLMFATDGLNRLFSNDLAPVRLARDLGLAAVDRIPPLKRLFMRHAMGVVGDLPRLLRGEAL